jgi:uncharacterized iron-regulated membrane protein
MIRSISVLVHRWLGLAMAAFLVVVGLSGSILAFYPELDGWLTPQFHLANLRGQELSGTELIRRAEAIEPRGQVRYIDFGNGDAALVRMDPRPGDNNSLGFNQLFLNPVTGEEVGRRLVGALPEGTTTIMPFIYHLHYALALGSPGKWILGAIALLWTIDCFVAFYLTLPASTRGSRKTYLARWKPAWLIKLRGSLYRINFDLHRASGLWLWAALLTFAWSSVYMDMNQVYSWATGSLFDYEQSFWFRSNDKAPDQKSDPMNWEAAMSVAERLASRAARTDGFTLDHPVSLSIDHENHLYEYRVHTSRDIGARYAQTFFWFDASSGELRSMILPTGHRAGNTLTTWLVELHMANLWGLPYKIFVCVLGIVISALSITGVYIWWRKRCARRSHGRSQSQANAPPETIF